MSEHDPFKLASIPPEMWPIERIVPYENNNKVHTDNHVKVLAENISNIGLLDPLIVEEDGTIIAGHGRFGACKLLQHKLVPVRVARGLTKEEAKIARIAHNKTASIDYDFEAMKRDVADMTMGDDFASLTGLTGKELDMLTSDIDVADIASLTEDLQEELSDQEEKAGDLAKEIDKKEEPIVKVLGFKSIPVADIKTVNRFMAIIMHKYGTNNPAEAMLRHMREAFNV